MSTRIRKPAVHAAMRPIRKAIEEKTRNLGSRYSSGLAALDEKEIPKAALKLGLRLQKLHEERDNLKRGLAELYQLECTTHGCACEGEQQKAPTFHRTYEAEQKLDKEAAEKRQAMRVQLRRLEQEAELIATRDTFDGHAADRLRAILAEVEAL